MEVGEVGGGWGRWGELGELGGGWGGFEEADKVPLSFQFSSPGPSSTVEVAVRRITPHKKKGTSHGVNNEKNKIK